MFSDPSQLEYWKLQAEKNRQMSQLSQLGGLGLAGGLAMGIGQSQAAQKADHLSAYQAARDYEQPDPSTNPLLLLTGDDE